jgi:hypothetical protein
MVVFLMLVILAGLKGKISIVLICISFMTKVIKHLFIHVLISSFSFFFQKLCVQFGSLFINWIISSFHVQFGSLFINWIISSFHDQFVSTLYILISNILCGV